MAKVDQMVHMPVSIMVGRSRAMDDFADRVLRAAQQEAAKSRLTGAYMESLKVAKVPGRSGRGKRVTDRLIYSDDEAAGVIEWGRYLNRSSPGAGKTGGKFVMTRTLASMRPTRSR